MSTRDEIEAVVDRLVAAATGAGWAAARQNVNHFLAVYEAKDELLALVAPPAPGEVTERDAMLALAVALEADDPNADGRAAPYREQASHLLDRLRGQGYRLAALEAAAAPEQSR